MLILLLERMSVPDNRKREILEKLARIKTVVSAVFYTVMVFVVIFGISGDVYAGFPGFAPYLIIAVFLFMAFIRMYQCMVDDGHVKRSVSKQLEEIKKMRIKKAAKAAASGTADEAGAEQKETDDSVLE